MNSEVNWVQSKKENGVMTIRLNRADKQNALTQAMYFTMLEFTESAQADNEVKVIVLEGVGDNFTAGNDIADFLATNSPIEETGAVVWLRSLEKCRKPIVAKVRGNAIGIGTTCLFHCDLIYADTTSQFSMPFTQLGLCPEAGVSLLLPKLIGYHKAAELLLLGKRFKAEDALQMNMINQVVEPEQLDNVVAEVVTQLASLPQDSVILTKSLLKTEPEPVAERMGREFALFEQQLHSDTAKAIFEQFLKR